MCGEVFSSEFSPEIKARVDQPHPLARPGRWSVVFSLDGESGVKASRERSFIDRDADWQDRGEGGGLGFSSEAAAKAAIARFGASLRHFVIPPAESYGDHDASRLSHEQLVALGNAILNNDSASYEALRAEYADLTRGSPAPTFVVSFSTRAEAAEAIVAFLTDSRGSAGNEGDYVDLDIGEYDPTFEISNERPYGLDGQWPGAPEDAEAPEGYGSVDYLRDLIRAYHAHD